MAYSFLSILVLVAHILQVFAASSPSPYAMTWSSKTFGPDGPWQAVQVSVGLPVQQVSLYPGGTFRSHLLTPQICTNVTLSPSACFASPAGLYAIESSTTALQSTLSFPAAIDYTHGGLSILGSPGIGSLDQMNLGSVTVPNVTLAVYDDIAVSYPSGLIAGLQVGTLGLGYLGTENQSFTVTGSPSINGSLIPGYLYAKNLIPSNSFGLQIGSVRPKIGGSLYFGGYDQTRTCGEISTQKGPFAGIEPDDNGKKGLIDLLDIEINVVDGPSPLNVSSITSLLTSGNVSIGPALSLPLLPETPYLDLPKSTCDAIAAWLPVNYHTDLGLYIWDTDSPLYTTLISSPTVLSFVFRANQSNTQNLTINIPFMLLNLTLEAPLVTSLTPYFPCNAQAEGRYSLGRAFLQAAFVGANWNANGNEGVWWLAQAPGPNVASQSSVLSIEDEDVGVVASTNDWRASWEGVLVPVASAAGTAVVSAGTALPSASNSDGSNAGAPSGLSIGSKVGIGAGAAACVVGLTISLFVLLFVRKRKAKANTEKEFGLSPSGTTPMTSMNAIVSPFEGDRIGGNGPSELHSHEVKDGYLVEMQGHDVRPIYEMEGSGY